MKNIFLIKVIFLILLLAGCETIKKKSDAIVKQENEKLTKYIGGTLDVLRMDLGKPDEDYKNEEGNLELVYKKKKYGISCERKFEIDSNSIVIGFVSNGCF